MGWAKATWLRVWLRENEVIRGIDFEFESDFVVIYGRTGSGKTTLMHAMLGIIPEMREGRVEGELNVLGMDPREGIEKTSERAGIVLQEVDHNLFGLSVMDELGEMENPEIVKKLGIENLLDREISSLSYGEKQRVAIAASLMKEAEGIFLDEPLAHLDVRGRRELEKLLRELSSERKIFVVEHRHTYFEFAERYEMFDGRLFPYSASHKGKLRRISPSSEEEILKVESLSARIGEFELKDVSFSMKKGEILGVVGLNGSGKTTLGRALAGLLPFSGKIKLNGKEMTRKELRGKIGYMSQNPDLQIFTDRVRKEIELTSREDPTKIMKMLELEKYSEKDPHALSKGERLKVVAGALLASGCDVVIFDEVTAGQDPFSIYNLMKTISLSGKSVILITHELDLIRSVCERAVVIRGGEAEVVDSSEISEKSL